MSSCYKYTGKERDAETNNDDFGARYYSSQFGRWLSPDWSAIPAPVPYANLSNPQTLNLYAMVSDNPETFADLDGHVLSAPQADGSSISFLWSPNAGQQDAALQAAANNNPANSQAQNLMVTPNKETDVKYGSAAREQIVDYTVVSQDSNGKVTPVTDPHKLELNETLDKGNAKKVGYCDSAGKCAQAGVTPDNPMKDKMAVTSGAGPHTVTKRFQIDGSPARIYDPDSAKAYNFVKVDASVKKGFVFNYGNDPN